MARKREKRAITEQDFTIMKMIRENNPKFTLKQVGELVGVSESCAARAMRCDSWGDYEKQKQKWREYNTKKTTEPQTKPESKTANNYQLNRIYDQLEMQNKNLSVLIACFHECANLIRDLNEKWQ